MNATAELLEPEVFEVDFEPILTPVEEDRRGFELIDGDWVEKPGMGAESGVVTTNVSSLLTVFVRRHRVGVIGSPEVGFRLFPDRPKHIRKPDVSFIDWKRLPDRRVPRGNVPFAPDFAVEVVSPNDEAEVLETKLDEYLRAGVRLIWFVYPLTKNVWAYKPDGTAKLYRIADTLTGEDVLPGFTANVSELFEGIEPA